MTRWWNRFVGNLGTATEAYDPDAIEHHVARDDEARAEGRITERQAVVLFARRLAAKKGNRELGYLADMVARGEHLS